MWTHREQLQISLEAWERLITLYTTQYNELLDDEKPLMDTMEYIRTRLNYCFGEWCYTQRLLSKLPPLKELPAVKS